ncbi:MAG: hypothetical protein AAF086_07485 [Planctomycetota bacterium]
MSDPAPAAPPLSAATQRPAIAPWRSGVAAARANVVPGMVLSVFAVGLLLSYWYVPAATAALETLAEWKLRLGWPFVVVSTAVFGAVIPWLVQRARPSVRAVTRWSHLWFLVAFWGFKGLEIDLLYRLQAAWFGQGSDAATLTIKTVVDQAIYCPVWAVPSTVLVYAFKDAEFSWARTWGPVRQLGLVKWYGREVLPVLISNAGVWVPAVLVIYCLPLALQLPVQNLVLCFWSLLLAFQVRGAAR